MKITLYHGTDIIIESPIHNKGRIDVDFGIGFYTTPDKSMAMKWASRKKNSIVNIYELETEGLLLKHFSVDQEWLDFVVSNRNMEDNQIYNNYDILIGATADDKLFSTIEQYEAGFLPAETAIKVLNCMNYSEQYVFKNEKSLSHLTFQKALTLDDRIKAEMITENKSDRKRANELTEQIIRNATKTISKKRGKSR